MAPLVLLLALLVAPEEPAKPPAAGSGTPTVAAVASKTIVGEIVWVDFSSRLVLVRESVKSTAVKGKPATRETIALAVAPDVPVIRGKQASTFAALKPKDHVVARYLPLADGAKAVSLRVADATTVPPPAAGDAPPAPAGNSNAAN
jgi:hypothetical protein